MNFNNPQKNNSITAHLCVCAIVFILFTFTYLYYFQADILCAAQHVLSNGVTNYRRFSGALLLTAFLQVLQIIVYRITHLRKNFHALTYFPSFLILAFITSVSSNIDKAFSFGAWPWAMPCFLIIYIGIVFVAKKLEPYESTDNHYVVFSKSMAVNMLLFIVMMAFTGTVGNSDDEFHYRCAIENALLEDDYDHALEIGNKSLVSDGNITMLRVYALARKGQLGDRLFEYPLTGTSKNILPSAHSCCIMYPADSIYRFLGGVPKQKPIAADRYLYYLMKSGHASRAAYDYLLCGYLIDRNLEGFARALPRYYHINDSLPKHYREALTLYCHRRSNPIVLYSNEAMEADFADMEKLRAQYPDKTEQRYQLYDNYGGSYWCYYFNF